MVYMRMKITKYFLFMFSIIFFISLVNAEETQEKAKIGDLIDSQTAVVTGVDAKGNPKHFKATGKGVLYASERIYGIKNLECKLEEWLRSRGTCVKTESLNEYEEIANYPSEVIEDLTIKVSSIINSNNYIPIDTIEITNYKQMQAKTITSFKIAKEIALLFDESKHSKKTIEENLTSACVYIFSNVIIEKILFDNKISFEDCVIGALEEEILIRNS